MVPFKGGFAAKRCICMLPRPAVVVMIDRKRAAAGETE
jgi:hypothetical protein